MPPVNMPPTFPVVGQIKSFGETGQKYKVGSEHRQLESGDWVFKVTVIDSGEEWERELNDILRDPEAN